MRASRQPSLHLPEWGGLRKGAGRKANGRRPFSHTKRKSLDERHPVHVTMRALPEIPSLRAMGRAVKQALFAGAKKEDSSFRLIHFGIQSNHLHLIVEATSTKALSLGIQGLAIRVAWAVNRAIGRKRGKVFSDRYHDHHLATPSEVHASLVYVINNHRKHLAEQGRFLARSYRDPHSSAPYLHQRGEDCPLPRPETWFLRGGYLKAGGEIDLSRIPGQRPVQSHEARSASSDGPEHGGLRTDFTVRVADKPNYMRHDRRLAACEVARRACHPGTAPASHQRSSPRRRSSRTSSPFAEIRSGIRGRRCAAQLLGRLSRTAVRQDEGRHSICLQRPRWLSRERNSFSVQLVLRAADRVVDL